MLLGDHPHVKNVGTIVEPKGDGTVEVVMVIDTDLEMSHGRPGYDEKKANDLIAAVQKHMLENPFVLGSVRIRSSR